MQTYTNSLVFTFGVFRWCPWNHSQAWHNFGFVKNNFKEQIFSERNSVGHPKVGEMMAETSLLCSRKS